MKVHLIKQSTIRGYTLTYPQSRIPFKVWLSVIKYADWNVPGDIVKTFNSADILGKGSKRVVFNIGGNNYRMICFTILERTPCTCLSNGLEYMQNIQS